MNLFDFPHKEVVALVQYLGPDDIFLIGANGLLWGCDEIEKQLQEEESIELFGKGWGEYIFNCSYNEEQRGDYGRIELPSWWDIEEVSFKPYEMEKSK